MKCLKKNNYLLITTICAFIIISIIFYLQKVSPLGENSLLTTDFFHQYGPMMGELWDRIMNGSNLIYSFNMGLGLPFFRNFFNYLSSPFNIVLFFFSKTNLLTSYSVIIALKVVAASVTMAYFLSKKLDNKYLSIPLALLYAFCAYFGAYYWNIMWLDGLVMLPLIILGIEKIIDNEKILFYIISLALMLFANYFIGYMLYIFSCLYFIVYLILKTDKFNIKIVFRKCILFIISSLLAGGLCAFFLIPLFDGLHSISATKDAFPITQYYDFTFKEYIFNHLSGVGSTVFKSDITNAPNISVGIIPIILVCLFVVNPKLNIKTKLCYLFLLGFMFISFICAPLDFIWHGFHVPNDLPYRYSFIYSFIIVLISALSLNQIKDVKKIVGTLVYIFIMIFIYLSKEFSFLNITREMITLNYALASIFYLGFMLCKLEKLKYPIIIITTIACMGEIIYTIDNSWEIDQNLKSFYSDYEETKDILKEIKDYDNDGFYRIERDNMLTFNDPSWYNYYGLIAFSSMEYESNALLLYGLGAQSNQINSFNYEYNTPIYNTLFALNYIIGNTYLNSYEYMDDIYNSVYKNPYKGSLMYGVNSEIKNYTLEYSPFINQNNLITSMTGVSDVLKPLQIDSYQTIFKDNDHKIIKYNIKNNFNNVYVYHNSMDIDFIIINDMLYYSADDYDYADNYINNTWGATDYYESYIISELLSDEYIEIYVGYNYYNEEYEDTGFEIYEVDYDNWNNAYEILNNNSLKIDEFYEYKIKTHSNFEQNKSIYTSIPYDKGWKVYVDGKEIKTYSIANALLGFDIEKGEHQIYLKYTPKYFKIGIIISILSLGSIIILTMIIKRKSKNDVNPNW